MALLLTLDASVFVAACRAEEPGYAASKALFALLRKSGSPLMEPALAPVETAAALARAGFPSAQALEYALSITSLPRLTLAPVDPPLAEAAARLAVHHGMRGADAIYAAVADLFGSVLVTLDREQLHRAPKHLHACTPDGARRLLLK